MPAPKQHCCNAEIYAAVSYLRRRLLLVYLSDLAWPTLASRSSDRNHSPVLAVFETVLPTTAAVQQSLSSRTSSNHRRMRLQRHQLPVTTTTAAAATTARYYCHAYCSYTILR
eukprot:17017-Heterococcus_DN1.PRE.4